MTDEEMDDEVRRMAVAGNVQGLRDFAYGGPCACLGPRDGEQYCPCEQRHRSGEQERRWRAVARLVVPYRLNKGQIILRGASKVAETAEEKVEETDTGPEPDAGVELNEIEIGPLESLLKALEALQNADHGTRNGIASDHCRNAAREIRLAMREIGG